MYQSEEDGYWYLTATVENNRVLWDWLLGKGTELMVLSPESLKNDITAEIAALAGWYGVTETITDEEESQHE